MPSSRRNTSASLETATCRACGAMTRGAEDGLCEACDAPEPSARVTSDGRRLRSHRIFDVPDLARVTGRDRSKG